MNQWPLNMYHYNSDVSDVSISWIVCQLCLLSKEVVLLVGNIVFVTPQDKSNIWENSRGPHRLHWLFIYYKTIRKDHFLLLCFNDAEVYPWYESVSFIVHISLFHWTFSINFLSHCKITMFSHSGPLIVATWTINLLLVISKYLNPQSNILCMGIKGCAVLLSITLSGS